MLTCYSVCIFISCHNLFQNKSLTLSSHIINQSEENQERKDPPKVPGCASLGKGSSIPVRETLPVPHSNNVCGTSAHESRWQLWLSDGSSPLTLQGTIYTLAFHEVLLHFRQLGERASAHSEKHKDAFWKRNKGFCNWQWRTVWASMCITVIKEFMVLSFLYLSFQGVKSFSGHWDCVSTESKQTCWKELVWVY